MAVMINIKEITEFDETIFRDFYNEWMTTKDTRTIETPETLGILVLDNILLYNIDLDFPTNSINALDIGCANGRILFNLMQNNLISSGIGIDVSDAMIMLANKCNEVFQMPIQFINSSLENFNTDDKFNIIVAQEVVEHFLSPEKAIEKIYNLLVPTGFFYGNVPLDHTCDALPHLNYYNMESLYNLLHTQFNRITIILIDIYEDVANPPLPYEYHLWFRCQKDRDDGKNIYAVTSL